MKNGSLLAQLTNGWRSLLGALLFYTNLPLPAQAVDLTHVARWAPLVGLGLGAGLAALAWSLQALGVPPLTRSALVVASGWLATGGLHLDGAMDTADGLAVREPQRRLAVMQDSRSGAFGVMAAVAIALFKVAALSELPPDALLWALPAAAAWGRWGQVLAIARYPNLRPEGKGAWHQRHLRQPQDSLLSTATVLGFAALQFACSGAPLWFVASSQVCGGGLAVTSGWWLQQRLGGHTGDTYGAIVEWTEALLLVAIATLAQP